MHAQVDSRLVRTNNGILFLRVFLTLVSLCAATCVTAEEKLTFPGAIVSVVGPSGAVGALSTNLAGVPAAANFATSQIGQRVIFLKDSRTSGTVSAAGIQASSVQYDSPIKYSRKNDLCKRAKTRRLMSQLGGRARCSPDWALSPATVPDSSPLSLPNDPGLFQQYALAKMRVPMVWPRMIGGHQSLVLVIDSGVDYTHPDLKENMWVNPGEIPGNQIDDDRNGYIDDIHGFNALKDSGDPMDEVGHGTHVAGIIGAVGNNGVGVTGVAWKTKIVAAKNCSLFCPTSASIKCLNYGVALKKAGHNVTVSNAS